MSKRALITGITGQDGSYLAEFLLDQGYEVHGLVRRIALEDPERRYARIHHLLERLTFHTCGIENLASVYQVFSQNEFAECYHLAAQSYVAESFNDRFGTFDINIGGTHHVLSAIKELQPKCRFFFAGSSEMFGQVSEMPQTETTRFYPRNPYGISKVAGFHLTRNFREAYGLHCVSGMLFSHESPRRGREFVTRKITSGVARIKAGLDSELRLGNLEAKRDWGHAADYVRAMHLMLQHEPPDDYIVATGEAHSVRQFCEYAFGHVGLDYREFVKIDERFFRPAEVDILLGDATRARKELGWSAKHSFKQLVESMVDADVEQLSQHQGQN